MTKVLLSVLSVSLISAGSLQAQRYATEIFDDNQIVVSSNITYGTNIDFLTSDLGDPFAVGNEVVELQTIASTTGEYPADYFNPASSTSLVLRNLQMDIYQPDPEIDEVDARPLMVYVHTGNFLPPPINGSPNGTKTDSLAIVACTQWAKRGFVAASVAYRLGWNPIAESVFERRGTLLNAVYRAIHDVKQAVRTLRADAEQYGIDPTKVVLFGEGSGGYVVLAYATLDDNLEVFESQFINPLTSSSFVDTNAVGNVTGLGGTLNLYRDNGQSTEINMIINAGGALGDVDWLEAGDAAMVSFHAVRDDFAPFDEGTVIVPTTLEDVVDVVGPNVFMPIANAFGNNTNFDAMPDGPVNDRARSLYGDSFEVSNGGNITISTNAENLFPVIRPLSGFLTNTASPWQWWDPNSPLALAEVAPGVTAHQASLASNPTMSPAQGRAYLDTIQAYAIPRVMCELALPEAECGTSSISEVEAESGLSLFPNPANEMIQIEHSSAVIRAVEIFDLTGKLVDRVAVNANRFTYNTANLPQGLYYVRADVEGTLASTRFIVSH